MEISSLGRLHFHGRIQINEIPMFLSTDLKRLMENGTLEIDSISDPEKWLLYCTKQKVFMNNFCDKNTMVYHFNNITEINVTIQSC